MADEKLKGTPVKGNEPVKGSEEMVYVVIEYPVPVPVTGKFLSAFGSKKVFEEGTVGASLFNATEYLYTVNLFTKAEAKELQMLNHERSRLIAKMAEGVKDMPEGPKRLAEFTRLGQKKFDGVSFAEVRERFIEIAERARERSQGHSFFISPVEYRGCQVVSRSVAEPLIKKYNESERQAMKAAQAETAALKARGKTQ